ncbi:MAG: hypothetical protein AAF744_13570 [Pseudomonadota bacterium]
MSDPAKNAEVEDVLSSIRRLVSEDKRPLQPAPSLPEASEPAPAPKADRLVLTPALRVADAPPKEAGTGGVEDDPAAEVQAAPEPGDQYSETSDAPEEVQAQDVAEPHATALEDDYSDDPYGFDAEDIAVADSQLGAQTEQGEETLSAKIAALETAIGHISDNWEPDGTTPDENTATEAPAMEWQDDTADAATAMAWQDDERDEADPSLDWQDARGESASMMHPQEDEGSDANRDEPMASPRPQSNVAVENEAVSGRRDPGDALMFSRRDAPAAAAAEAPEATRDTQEPLQKDDTWPDQDEQAEPTLVSDVSGQATTAAAAMAARTEGDFDLTEEDQLLDEETLRELITEIVHSELQGALGERITRNVRRLVRREIHRALTARDLD